MPELLPDPAVVSHWLQARRGHTTATVTAIEQLEGGASNITCRIKISGGPWPEAVLRLQRLHGIFEPYDVLREGRVLEALAGTAVPVPRVLGREAEPSVLGAPFLLLEYIDAPHMGVAGREASYEAFAAMVATVHQVNWAAGAFAFLGVPHSPTAALHAELDVVQARLRKFVGDTEPLLIASEQRLRAAVPKDGHLALCQGDINVFNYLFRAGRVAAVVDWEQARISDLRSDIGQLIALSNLKGAPFAPADAAPFARAYMAAGGEALANLAWFRARWLWELGVIYHGWVTFNGSSPWYSWEHLVELLQLALVEL
ncbi:MAG: phosphotransferase family protein [Dehalococcoidia bacterium]|nr:phosphotransferase family protein [Dehalococcoidia bacterium]